MVQVKSPQDLGAGLVFTLIGLAGFYFGADLTVGTGARMGPGYFPVLLSGLITAVGLVLGLRGVTVEGPPIEPVQLRPIFFIIAAILVFGFLIESIGLALTSVLLTILATYARPEVKLSETVLLGVGLAMFTVVVFVYVLGQPLPAWWGR
jgi:hypothetical protein